jgi:hypothetical protein
MTPQRFQQVRNLFEAALERDTSERAAFVTGACQNDQELQEEVWPPAGSTRRHRDPRDAARFHEGPHRRTLRRLSFIWAPVRPGAFGCGRCHSCPSTRRVAGQSQPDLRSLTFAAFLSAKAGG